MISKLVSTALPGLRDAPAAPSGRKDPGISTCPQKGLGKSAGLSLWAHRGVILGGGRAGPVAETTVGSSLPGTGESLCLRLRQSSLIHLL